MVDIGKDLLFRHRENPFQSDTWISVINRKLAEAKMKNLPPKFIYKKQGKQEYEYFGIAPWSFPILALGLQKPWSVEGQNRKAVISHNNPDRELPHWSDKRGLVLGLLGFPIPVPFIKI